MRPDEYENFVSRYFKRQGYNSKITPFRGDYGTDLIIEKNRKKIAVQVKMYGQTSRKINRRMIMEFYGSAKYFGCNGAIIVTDGDILPEANEVAQKLGVKIMFLPASRGYLKSMKKTQKYKFSEIWEKYIIPLEGKVLKRPNGSSNKIVRVDWSGIRRITSNGKEQFIEIEIFRFAINHILNCGSITRRQINDQYDRRASSGIVLILSQIPFFRLNRKILMSIEMNRVR